jgi:hypothetical protein
MHFMIRRVTLGALALCAAVSCTEMSVLSKSAYDHQQRAAVLTDQGNYEAAAEQQAEAEKARYKMARVGNSWEAPQPRL